MTNQIKNKLGRREFLGAAAAASFTILKPQFVRGTALSSQVRFGVLGCGGRGTEEFPASQLVLDLIRHVISSKETR